MKEYSCGIFIFTVSHVRLCFRTAEILGKQGSKSPDAGFQQQQEEEEEEELRRMACGLFCMSKLKFMSFF